ncbi:MULTISPECIES: metallophosphoesterase [Bacteria]|uniref:metallophosphoesterase n=1 Tax=Bacteria TaxID=2 RepID=UPI002E7AF6A9|nr:metallophosphoesterase [Cetobacterium somerae]WVJ03085.1 metallophosphoesterase [Cetobacterium somerae]
MKEKRQLVVNSENGFVVFLDVHFGKKCGIRIDDVDLAIIEKLKQILLYCIENKISVVLTAGDIFDGVNVSRTALFQSWQIFNEFKKNNIDVFVIFGNHDLYRGNYNISQETPLYFLIQTGVVKLYPKLLTIQNTESEYNVSAFSYHEEIEENKIEQKNSVLIAHTFYDNEFMGKGHNLTKEDVIKLKYHKVILGHDHSRYNDIEFDNGYKVFRFGSLARVSTTPGELSREIGFMHFNYNSEVFVSLVTRNLEEIAKAETKKVKEITVDYTEIIDEIQKSSIDIKEDDIVLKKVNSINNEFVKKIILENI